MKKTTSLSKLLSALIVIAMICSSSFNFKAQNEESGSLDMKASLNSDIFFGYEPFFAGSKSLNDNMDFTFYGILWSRGTGAAWGNWTEFGVGMGMPISESIYINPQIGLLNGSLTSGLGTPTVGEGIVPNLTATFGNDKIEAEFYGGYYYGLDQGNTNTNNYLNY